jgi:hypothetical protein
MDMFVMTYSTHIPNPSSIDEDFKSFRHKVEACRNIQAVKVQNLFWHEDLVTECGTEYTVSSPVVKLQTMEKI